MFHPSVDQIMLIVKAVGWCVKFEGEIWAQPQHTEKGAMPTKRYPSTCGQCLQLSMCKLHSSFMFGSGFGFSAGSKTQIIST